MAIEFIYDVQTRKFCYRAVGGRVSVWEVLTSPFADSFYLIFAMYIGRLFDTRGAIR